MTFPYADGMCFLGSDEDIAASGLSAFVCDVSADEAGNVVRDFGGVVAAVIAARARLLDGGRAFLATSAAQLRGAPDLGRTAVVLQIQGCDALEGDLSRINVLHALGVRVLQLTHHADNALGGGCLGVPPRRLSALGRAAVERMNAIGMVPDLAHASRQTALDAAAMSRRAVVISHTGPGALVRSPRCADDDVLHAVAETGGVVGLFMMSFWVTPSPSPSPEEWVQALRHMIDVAGVEHVGVANDFPLAGNALPLERYVPWWKAQGAAGVPGFAELPNHVVFPAFNHIRRMESLHDALRRSGFAPSACELVLGGNWLRVLAEELG